MKKIIEHISGSFLNSYENYRNDFIKHYVYWEEIPENIAMKFWKDYENILAKTLYKGLKQQIEIKEDIEWYEILWYVDFWNDDVWIECKTKNGRRTKKEIKDSRQFRIYNYFKWDREFKIHQYNKKQQRYKVQSIGFEDKEFIPEIYCKIKEIENFLSDYDVSIWRNLNK